MAVQVESRGQLQEFVDILLRRKWQVILPAAFVITIGTAYAVLVPKKYLVRTQIELRPVSISISSKEGANASWQIKASSRIRKVVQELSHLVRGSAYLALEPAKQTNFIEEVQTNIRVNAARDASGAANFITIEYTDAEALWAIAFLRELRDDWIQDVLNRDLNKVEDEEKKLREEMSKLDRQRTQEEKDLTELKRAHGISATQPIPGATGAHSEDPVYTRLQGNKSLKERTDLDLIELEVEIKELQEQYDEMPENLRSESLVEGRSNEAELEDLDLEYLAIQQELKKYRPAHPKHKQAQQKARDLEERRDQLIRLATKTEVQSTATPNPARAKLRAEIDLQEVERDKKRAIRKKVAADIELLEDDYERLQQVYSEIRERAGEIDRLAEAQKSISGRYHDKVAQGRILSSPLSSPFEITQDVMDPGRATEPNPMMIIAFSVIAGLGAGLGLAILLEYSKNCFRSVNDISRVMVVPVLGSINTIVTRREARLAAARRVLVGLSSAAALGAIMFVTWAWEKNQDLLSPYMREKIKVIRSMID